MDTAYTFCCITYPDHTGHNTAAKSLFAAAAKALHWCEVDCRDFGTARRFRDDQFLEISVYRMGTPKEHRVQIGRVRQWVRSRADISPSD